MLGGNRKRAYSTPHLSPAIAAMLRNNNNAYYSNQTFTTAGLPVSYGNLQGILYAPDNSNNLHELGGTANTAWSGQGRSENNIYTQLALGDERYLLPNDEAQTRESSVGYTTAGDDEEQEQDLSNSNASDADEATDQFSPTIYATQSRAIPIPLSVGSSPQHLRNGQRLAQHAAAYSASPTSNNYAYSPFYAGSPDRTPNRGMASAKISYSLDPAMGFTSRLPNAQHPQQHKQREPNARLSSPNLRTSADGAPSVGYPSAISPPPAAAITNNSASGTSAVAIDNKIEQAMDLVKSHLMIAVREEVEVLKEKISELMDKINQLEIENTLLKANMSQETLQKLQMQIAAAPAQQQLPAPTQAQQLTAPPTQQQQAVPQQQQQGQEIVASNIAANASNNQDAQQQQQQQQQQPQQQQNSAN